MNKIFTLFNFIAFVFLMSSCAHQSYSLTNYASAYEVSQGKMLAKSVNKPVAARPSINIIQVVGNANQKTANNNMSIPKTAELLWVATTNPHVASAASKMSNKEAIALSAATTAEGHAILRREIEKAMKGASKETEKSARELQKTRNKKKVKQNRKVKAEEAEQLISL